MRIVRLLVGNPPQTVSDLIKTSGVTRTAVTEQLNELVAAGYVERTIERLPGRGRPRHLYSATKTTLAALFDGNEHLVVPAIWQAVESIGSSDLLDQVLKRLAEILANHYLQRITAENPADRLRQIAQLLQEEGGMAEAQINGKMLLHKKSCAFFCMLDSSQQTICRVDEEMLRLIIGQQLDRVAWRHNGDACCTFEILANASS